MKRVLLIFTLLLSTMTIKVKAINTVNEEQFKEMLLKEKYQINYIDSGYIAYNSDFTYIYKHYNSVEEAQKEFKSYADMKTSEEATINVIEEYNIDNSENTNYNIIGYEYDLANSTVDDYYHIYRIDDALIYGYGDMSKKDEIKATLERVINGKSAESPEKSSKLVLVGSIFLALLAVLGVVFTKKHKISSKKKSKD